MENVTSMQPLIEDNFLEYYVHFLMNIEFSMPTSLHYNPQLINFFFRKYPIYWGEMPFKALLYIQEICDIANIFQNWKLVCGQISSFSMSERLGRTNCLLVCWLCQTFLHLTDITQLCVCVCSELYIIIILLMLVLPSV